MLNNKKDFQAILFDLDGTLINSLYDIADSMNKVLEAHNYPVHDYNAYKLLVGRGLKNLAEKALPEDKRDEQTIDRLHKELLVEYGNNAVNKTVLYEEIPEMLDKLEEKGIKTVILSNKDNELTQKIAGKIFSKWHFSFIMGSQLSIPRKPDPAGALLCCKKIGIKPEDFLYLGDSGIDMQTANAAGMFAVGVTWGFRSKAELIENGAAITIDKPMDLFNKID